VLGNTLFSPGLFLDAEKHESRGRHGLAADATTSVATLKRKAATGAAQFD
jgi:hypothetical protein